MDKITEAIGQYSILNETFIKAKISAILSDKLADNRNKKVYETILSCIDLTSLNSTDTEEEIANMTDKVNIFEDSYPELPNVAAICVYPSMVNVVHEILTAGVEIATVTGGFPHSQTFIEVKIAETSLAVMDGATEIDIVFPIGKLLEGKNEEIIEELQEIKTACRDAKLKIILESGALKIEDIQRSAILSMESGADFIKTSTGKQQPAATTLATFVMCQMILEYYQKSGRKVGFKAAGGISTTEEALQYYCIVESVLGSEWLNKDLLRFGASKLANNILCDIIGETISCF